MRRAYGLICHVTVTVNRSDGQSRQFHFIRRLASGGGCIWLKLRQRSVLHCQFAGRDADAMVKNRQRVDDLIDVLVWIRRRIKGLRSNASGRRLAPDPAESAASEGGIYGGRHKEVVT